MPAVKIPCVQCKEKHVKCDDEKPKCRRCELKHLPCSRPTKKTIFRHGSGANFAKDQEWVSSEAKQFRVQTASASTPLADLESPDLCVSPQWPPSTDDRGTSSSAQTGVSETDSPGTSLDNKLAKKPRKRRRLSESEETRERLLYTPSVSLLSPQRQSIPSISSLTLPNDFLIPEDVPNTRFSSDTLQAKFSLPSPTDNVLPPIEPVEDCDSNYRQFPLQDVQEACLMRYFVEEISRWFDLCDEQRHFQLVVPVRARRHPHLLNAIFAVSARHLSRLPQYKTAKGIMYHGQLLPTLHPHDAVEYMLKCIPAFRRFHTIHDDDFRDSIIATAVILRQLEEIDDEDDVSEASFGASDANGSGHANQVNFLPIINAVLRDPASQTLLTSRSLIQASYWFALRQEIYHSFNRREPPQLNLAPEYWQIASGVNKTVMHTVQVVKWNWGNGSDEEWLRLMQQQNHLEETVLADCQPLFQSAADRSKGEIFPTLWYASTIEAIGIQQAIMARSVLVAEDPFLKVQPASRSSWRKVENEVRVLMLDLCGIALCHPGAAPALVNAAIGIQQYGDFFTDHYERSALRGVVERYRDAHAWPVKRLLKMFE